jgi:hypothetical protein
VRVPTGGKAREPRNAAPVRESTDGFRMGDLVLMQIRGGSGADSKSLDGRRIGTGFDRNEVS